MRRIATEFRDKNDQVVFDNSILMNSRGYKFTIEWYAGEWSVVDSEGFIPFGLKDLLEGDSVEVIGIDGYNDL